MSDEDMKWIKNKISLLIRKKDWNIYLSQIGGYQLIEITDPISHWLDLSSIYLTLLDFIFKQCQMVMLSQFIDESQGMLDDKDQILSELSKQHGVKVAITKEYFSTTRPPSESREYVLNIIGKPSLEWFKKVLAYGGASLSNIMYGDHNFGNDWLEVAAKRNQIFTKWYWLETGDAELVRLRSEVKMLCWTSDTHINILSEENQVNGVISFIEEVASKHSLTVKINKKQ